MLLCNSRKDRGRYRHRWVFWRYFSIFSSVSRDKSVTCARASHADHPRGAAVRCSDVSGNGGGVKNIRRFPLIRRTLSMPRVDSVSSPAVAFQARPVTVQQDPVHQAGKWVCGNRSTAPVRASSGDVGRARWLGRPGSSTRPRKGRLAVEAIVDGRRMGGRALASTCFIGKRCFKRRFTAGRNSPETQAR